MSTESALEQDPLLPILCALAAGPEMPRLTIGGGYGLFLKQRDVERQGFPAAKTLLPPVSRPRNRTTGDIDLVLPGELIADYDAVRALRSRLDEMGFQPKQGKELFQFVRPESIDDRSRAPIREIKIDLLAEPPPPDLEASVHRTGDHPVRLRPSRQNAPRVKLHGWRTPEAVAAGRNAVEISLSAFPEAGEDAPTIAVPQSFTLLTMKLHAFRDWFEKGKQGFDPAETRDLGSHHAMDIYRIVALTAEREYEAAYALAAELAQDPSVAAAREIVQKHWRSESQGGPTRLREHHDYPSIARPDIETTIEVLNELFSPPR